MNQLPARTEGLPLSLIEIAETLGMRPAIALMEHYAGTEVKFPKNPPPDHPLIKALGETEGYALCGLLGGQLVYVPHGRRARNSQQAVVRLEGRGYSRAEIARELGISQRHVRRMANKDSDPRQPDMFSDQV